MDMRSRENYLIHVMNTGFERAAHSFSKFINRPVQIVNARSILIKNDNDFSYITEDPGDLLVLVTQVIGDISGKSFLIFSREESQEIFSSINASKNNALNEAFLLEIDNIISASVIAELSNAFDLEIYGDVPHLAKLHSGQLNEFLAKEITHDTPTSTIFCNTTFRFGKNERVHPQFIWKLSSKIFESIPEHGLTA